MFETFMMCVCNKNNEKEGQRIPWRWGPLNATSILADLLKKMSQKCMQYKSTL